MRIHAFSAGRAGRFGLQADEKKNKSLGRSTFWLSHPPEGSLLKGQGGSCDTVPLRGNWCLSIKLFALMTGPSESKAPEVNMAVPRRSSFSYDQLLTAVCPPGKLRGSEAKEDLEAQERHNSGSRGPSLGGIQHVTKQADLTTG